MLTDEKCGLFPSMRANVKIIRADSEWSTSTGKIRESRSVPDANLELDGNIFL